jgi:hypothetical protein
MTLTKHRVAQTIKDQIGHKAFVMMGTTDYIADTNALVFNIRGCRQWKKIKVELTPDDPYTVTFYKIGRAPGFRLSEKSVAGVFVSDLHRIISEETGLALSL